VTLTAIKIMASHYERQLHGMLKRNNGGQKNQGHIRITGAGESCKSLT
jgi:hypothetical protein